jgi:molybdopterin-guanine dinucleotide biosynthesis protein MobB
MIASGERWALMHELRGAPDPALPDLIRKLSPVDLVIIEGYKRDRHPKLEVHRPSVGKPLLHPDDPDIFAVASDAPLGSASLPVIDLGDAEAIADALVRHAIDAGALTG